MGRNIGFSLLISGIYVETLNRWENKSGGKGIVKTQQVNVVSIIDSFPKHWPRLFQQPGPFVS